MVSGYLWHATNGINYRLWETCSNFRYLSCFVYGLNRIHMYAVVVVVVLAVFFVVVVLAQSNTVTLSMGSTDYLYHKWASSTWEWYEGGGSSPKGSSSLRAACLDHITEKLINLAFGFGQLPVSWTTPAPVQMCAPRIPKRRRRKATTTTATAESAAITTRDQRREAPKRKEESEWHGAKGGVGSEREECGERNRNWCTIWLQHKSTLIAICC